MLFILHSPTETLSATDFFLVKLSLNELLSNTSMSNNHWCCAPQPQELIFHTMFHFLHVSDSSGLGKNRKHGQVFLKKTKCVIK